MKKAAVLIGIIFTALIAPWAVRADYDPPPGASGFYSFYSPFFLSGGLTGVSDLSPSADALNPAAAGAKQRFTLDFSYLTLLGLGSEEGFGQVLNFGATKPTRAGVLSGSAHFLNADFPSLDLGTLAGFHVSFAKDLYPELLVGAGLSAFFGADWGLGADLGFVHLYGPLGRFPSFRWGAALRGLGKGYAPGAGYTAFPEPFTPSLNACLGLLEAKQWSWGLGADLSFPSFQNARFFLGTELAYLKRFYLQAGSMLDLHELASGSSRDLPVSFGLAVKFITAIRQDQSEVKTALAAAPLQNGIWAFGGGANIPVGIIDRRPPQIRLAGEEKTISPNLDGVQDDLAIPISISDERFVKGYRFVVADGGGAQVREIVNKDERPENLSFKNIVDRLLYVKTGIPIPEDLRWDGRSDKGNVVADGVYTYWIEAWDDNGNRAKSESATVIVDNTPPSVEVKTPYLIFSPNGDGSKDTLPLEQSGSVEDSWKGAFLNVAGQEIAAFQWEKSAPQSFGWEGRNKEGLLAADGVYSYLVGAADRGGNKGSARVDNIIINTEATPITVGIGEAAFSPNADGIKDTLTFSLGVPVKRGIEKWSLIIRDAQKKELKEFQESQSIPDTILYRGDEASGKTLPEGQYSAALEVLYLNGNRPGAESPLFTVDLTPPSAAVSSDLAIFSPNGDGIKDFLTIYQETSEEPIWEGRLEDETGREVRSFSWRGRADSRLVWNGQDAAGRLLPDGAYIYSLSATDRAGNKGSSKRMRLELNTEQTSVFLTTDLNTFSPNADGIKDRIAILPTLKVGSGVESWQLRLINQEGRAVRSLRGQKRAPEVYSWDGLDDDGQRLPDGEYLAQMVLDYQKGDHHDVRTAPFLMDTRPPAIELGAEYALFSPDGDGRRDVLPLRQSSSLEDLWEGEILEAGGRAVRSFFWKGQALSFSWDGKDEQGNTLADGLYTYRVRSTDRAGNTAAAQLKGLEIDTRLTPIFLTASRTGFSPNGDGYLDDIDFKLYLGLGEGIRSWSLEMLSRQDGTPSAQKTFSGSGSVPASIVWNGKTEDGRPAGEGVYQARLSVEYDKGNRPEALSAPFILAASPPRVELKLSPPLFSPDNDGVDDELAIDLNLAAISPILEWSIQIDDPVGTPFASFSGKGTPAQRIIWDGRSDSGELVQAAEDYTLSFSVRDVLGNAASLKAAIPVDVLVLRDGDRLRIRIPSITFPPNSADLGAVTELDKKAKNEKTMKRLAEIFTKFKTYQIRIEGHANNLSWEDAAKAANEELKELVPLSSARAQAVKMALVELGLNPERITTAGLGGKEPVVPFRDTVNRWKNRRVEFILVRK